MTQHTEFAANGDPTREDYLRVSTYAFLADKQIKSAAIDWETTDIGDDTPFLKPIQTGDFTLTVRGRIDPDREAPKPKPRHDIKPAFDVINSDAAQQVTRANLEDLLDRSNILEFERKDHLAQNLETLKLEATGVVTITLKVRLEPKETSKENPNV